MQLIRIDTLDDDRLSVYRDLPKSNLTTFSGRFIVEGQLLVERLVASDYETESIVVADDRLHMIPSGVKDDVPVFVLQARNVEQLIGFNFHRGVLACGRRKQMSHWEQIFHERDAPRLYVACVDIQDPTNLGGVLRNCAAFGVDGVLLFGSTADPFSRRVLRVSMGTVFRLPIAHCPGRIADLQRIREEWNVKLVASVLDVRAAPLEMSGRPSRMGILIGNEGHGLGQEWVDACDHRVTLYMQLGTDSLNVAAASAVLLYHFTRVARFDGPVRATSGD